MHFSHKISCCMIIRVTWARWWLGCLHMHLANIRSHIVTGEPMLSWVGVYALTQLFLFCIMKAKNLLVGPHSALKRGPPHSHVLPLSFLASSTTAYTLPWKGSHAWILIQVKGLADDVDALYVKLVNIRWIWWCGIFAGGAFWCPGWDDPFFLSTHFVLGFVSILTASVGTSYMDSGIHCVRV
jgi:hypothetical protein